MRKNSLQELTLANKNLVSRANRNTTPTIASTRTRRRARPRQPFTPDQSQKLAHNISRQSSTEMKPYHVNKHKTISSKLKTLGLPRELSCALTGGGLVIQANTTIYELLKSALNELYAPSSTKYILQMGYVILVLFRSHLKGEVWHHIGSL